VELQLGVASQTSRAKLVSMLLITGAVIDAIAVVSGLAELELLGRIARGGGSFASGEPEANDTRQAIVGSLQVLAIVATATCWLLWEWRAYGNLTLLGTGDTRFSPRWVVWGWFIPIMHLFRPLQVVRDLWLRSEDRNRQASVNHLRSPTLLGWWWAAWIASGILGQIYFRASIAAESIGSLQAVAALGLLSDGLGVISGILAIVVVRRIDAFQKDAAYGGASPGQGESQAPFQPTDRQADAER
jgi:hypothetical protein